MLGLGINISKYRSTGQILPLLDQFPSAAAAYSLRELSTDWEGQPVVRVRRDVDNAEADFTMTEILDGELLAWVYGASSAAAFNTLPADHGPGAEAAFSLRYVSSTYSGDVVRVRRSLDNAEADFNPTEVADGTLEDWTFGGSSTLPADHGSGAYVAYSLRYVSSTYEATAAPVVRVRRSSDNAERDFTPSEITDGTLEAYCGAGDGEVTKLYNQTLSSSQDIIEDVAGFQPTIVSSGVLITDNGRAAMSNGRLENSNFYIDEFDSFNFSTVARQTGTNATRYTIDGTTAFYPNRVILGRDNFSGNLTGLWFNFVWYNGGPVNDEDQNVHYAFRSNSSNQTQLYKMESLIVNTNFKSTIWQGLRLSSAGYLQEFIMYNTDTPELRIPITKNQTAYYSITYDATGIDAFVTTWYDQTLNSNNLIQTTAGSQPVIVSAGVLHTKNGLPSISMDNNKILSWAGDTSVFVSGSIAKYTVFNVKSMNTVVNYGQSLPQITFDFGTNRVRTTAQINADGAGPTTYPVRFYANNVVNVQNIGIGWTGLLSCYAESGLIDNSTTLATLRLRREDIFNNIFTLNYGSNFNDGTAQFLWFNASPDADLSETIIYARYDVPEKSDIYANQSQYYGTRLATKNGYVTTWYDQSGNGNDATQTTSANQPKIVDAGAVTLESGLPAITFDGTLSYTFLSHSTSYSNITTIATAANSDSTEGIIYNISDGTNILSCSTNRDAAGTVSCASYNHTTADSDYDAGSYNGNTIIFSIHNTSTPANVSVDAFLNSIATANHSYTTRQSLTDKSIGGRIGLNFGLTGSISEHIIWNTDQLSNRVGIANDINSYYKIY